MNRRHFVKWGVAAAISSVSSAYAFKPQASQKHSNNKLLFGAYYDKQGQYFSSRVTLDKDSSDASNIDAIQIPFRAHDTLPLSAHKSLSFGRRPNKKMVVCDFNTGQQHIFKTKEGRHFYGHGCIQDVSNTLFTTENDYDNVAVKRKGKGVIGIRDSQTFQQIGEYDSFGIGPHDIKVMPDNKTLVVANGGIQTHPDFGRRKLNLKTMQPNLVFIDIDSGKKIDEYRLPNHQLSIRHLSVTPDGGVGIASQYQGKIAQGMPDFLLAWLGAGTDGLQILKNNRQFTQQCRGYIGDVAVDDRAQILAATSPRGNNLSLWDIKQARLIKTIQITGPCGLCFDKQNQEFLLSNETGAIYKVALNRSQNANQNTSYSSPQNQLLATQLFATKAWSFPVKWDNHMMILI